MPLSSWVSDCRGGRRLCAMAWTITHASRIVQALWSVVPRRCANSPTLPHVVGVVDQAAPLQVDRVTVGVALADSPWARPRGAARVEYPRIHWPGVGAVRLGSLNTRSRVGERWHPCAPVADVCGSSVTVAVHHSTATLAIFGTRPDPALAWVVARAGWALLDQGRYVLGVLIPRILVHIWQVTGAVPVVLMPMAGAHRVAFVPYWAPAHVGPTAGFVGAA